MVRRHYSRPFRFVCVTDDPEGLEDVETIELWPDARDVAPAEGRGWPNCHVRLRAFARDAAQWFGPRYVSLDLDVVVTGDLAPLFDRPESFVIWNETDWPRTQFYNASIWLMDSGARPQVWETFDPASSPAIAYEAGARGGDQAWISYVLGKGEAVFTPADGVLSYRRHIARASLYQRLPRGARLVCFHGAIDPWAPAAQRLPWVREHYNNA